MNVSGPGIKASKLVKELIKAIEHHGDLEVWAGGEDYPGGVGGVKHNDKERPYYRKDSFVIWTNSV